jgi:hypothetical protein
MILTLILFQLQPPEQNGHLMAHSLWTGKIPVLVIRIPKDRFLKVEAG